MSVRITLDDVLRRNDMSRRELSRRTGVHRDTVCKYAGNRVRIISLDLLEAVCAELQCGSMTCSPISQNLPHRVQVSPYSKGFSLPGFARLPSASPPGLMAGPSRPSAPGQPRT